MDSNLHQSTLLSIGAFSPASRLSQKALRLYGRHKLLSPAHTDAHSGYRYYTAAQLADARLILLLREMDMPLAQIQQVLLASPEDAANLVQGYIKQRDEKAKREKRVSDEVFRCLQQRHIRKGTPMTPMQEPLAVTTFEAEPQLIIAINKPLHVNALWSFFDDCRTRLSEFANGQPGLEIVGDAFAIFHGPVNQEDDGPVEVYFPVRGIAVPTGDIVLRELAGGLMATATGTPEQGKFPRVLEIYDAVTCWMNTNGYVMDGPPRQGWDERIQVIWPCIKAK